MRQRLRRSLKWFLPGMRIKRWLAATVGGIVLFSAGLMLLANHRALVDLELTVVDWIDGWTGFRPNSTWVDVAFILVGLAVMLWAMRGWFRSVYQAVAPGGQRQLVDVLYERRQLGHGLKIVAIGGGTGLSSLLRGLKHHTSNLTAIVTVADDGGSSGRLSKELGLLPPGDIRNCLVALADDESLLSELFQYRFQDGRGLEGHSFGNLFLAALTEVCGDFEEAIRRSSQILATRGRVLPATLSPVTLCARFNDNSVVRGESEITARRGSIAEVFLEPRTCRPPAEVIQALREADAVVLGPGSLYTSVVPPLLVDGLCDVLRRIPAPKIYVCNVMTQPGETDGYTAADHVEALHRHVGGHLVDYALVNTEFPHRLLSRYEEEGAYTVTFDLPRIERQGVQPVTAPLISETDLVRHDPARLAEALMRLIEEHRSAAGPALGEAPHYGAWNMVRRGSTTPAPK